ncbi:DMT family transporter [Spirosoma endbachense]|uniref:EamA family transporter n=1 Tax=Spirosoma endbachense TaxID=2666025 RepID=A0A6P1W9F4_9BACT|nr:DMT family transporter [Spirosoma endbachense]QHW00337.1 EamA family transporter [Spirosoma endbachense]
MRNKPEAWILYSIAAAFFWGTWGVVAKLISDEVSPFSNHLLFSIGMLLTLPLLLKKVSIVKPNRKGIGWGLMAGILAVTGNVAVYKAFSAGGLAAIVIPVTNLYPLVTIGIALLVFKEKLNWINAIGILLALPAVVMLSGESLLFDNPDAFFETIGLKPGADRRWLLYSLVALFFWGVFSAAQKETTNYISAEWSYMSFIVSSVLIALVFFVFGWAGFAMSTKTLVLGSLAGMLNGLGVLASFAAYSAEGKASKVTTIAGALQPVFTIVFAILFLDESLSIIESLGIVLAIIGALTLSFEKPKTEPNSVII